MTELSAYLAQFDDAWGHSFESFHSAVDGVEEDQAFFQHSAYAKETQEEGWPPPGSIAWQIAHLIHCKRHYTQHLERVVEGLEALPEVEPWSPIHSLPALLETSKVVHEKQRSAMAALRPEHLGVIAGNGMTVREFLAMIIRHDIWHASQIAVARRLMSVE